MSRVLPIPWFILEAAFDTFPDSCGRGGLPLRTHWVLVVIDLFTRRIIRFGVHRGTVDGPSPCSMFQRAIQGQALPKYLSTDNDPLYRFHQWQANLRVLEVMEIKTVPYVPLSHP